MKGIILAGGTGSRLGPVTGAVSKQLLPVFDKPMIFYPLATLMMAGLRELLIITNPHDEEAFRRLLGDGSELGIRIDYAVQARPEGIAQALLISEEFLDGDAVALILGDNIFHGPGLGTRLAELREIDGAHLFAYRVADPSAYGVITFDDAGNPVAIVEKPQQPTSAYAIPGLYFYSNDAVKLARELTPSERGELEITDLNRAYLDQGRLQVTVLPRGTAWLDTGTTTTLVQAADFVRVVEERQGLKVGCPEEVAWRHGWLTDAELRSRADRYRNSEYGAYLNSLPDLPPEPGA
ncbi:MAG TPA: glucose-1-phosphate thymidylyltransferase RfbA [Mycobacteriales bacterium]|nr:glucose-1-phosphate thymidylyltransferase RfbA [Mycobacteriales bacterium]